MRRRVGRYEILRELGSGGMATVYLARQDDLDRYVALKQLAALRAQDPDVARRFVRESQLAGGLNHPNIVTVHDFFEFEGTPYIAMEYLERGSLRPWIGRMTLAQIAGVLEGLLAGLAHAEDRHIVHRDIKPENVLLADDGRVKIADFGIAKATFGVANRSALTAMGTTVGTPAYMAPEQARARDIGPWTDLYSVGIMAFEMLLGRVPFDDTDTPVAILLRHVNEAIPAPHDLDPDVDPELSGWVERLLAKDPEARPRSARAAWDEIEDTIVRLVGPMWRREAPLLEPAFETASAYAPTPPTAALDAPTPPTAALDAPTPPTAPLDAPTPTTAPLGAPTPTAPMDAPSLAATVAPRTPTRSRPARPTPPTRAMRGGGRPHRAARLVKGALAAGALVIALGAIALGARPQQAPVSGAPNAATTNAAPAAATSPPTAPGVATAPLTSPRDQAAAASALADSYASQGRAAGSGPLADALASGAAAYRAVASAAQAGDRSRYQAATASARSADRRIAAARAAGSQPTPPPRPANPGASKSDDPSDDTEGGSDGA
jgi:hypothetical protein